MRERRSAASSRPRAIESRSVEYCSYIMEAVATGKPFRLMGNVRNDGYITNLPHGCCVEVPTFADDTGLHPTVIGELPPQCAALCMTNINSQILAPRRRSSRSGASGSRRGDGSADQCGLYAEGDPRDVFRDAGGGAAMAAGVRGQDDYAEAGDRDSAELRAGGRAARPGAG